MGFWDRLFKPKWKKENFQTFQELGTYRSIFSIFDGNIYKNDLVRSCIRPLAEITGKASAKCTNADVQRVLKRPNQFMNESEFLKKCRNLLEIKNTLFVLIQRDDRLKLTGLYPVPYKSFEAVQTATGQIFIKFAFDSLLVNSMVAPLEDLAMIRKDYIFSDIAGEDNAPLVSPLSLITTTNEGVGNAVKATANLRGILKSTRAMLKPEDVKEQKDRFVKDYMSLENEGGIASLDSTQEFIPISMNPTVTSSEQMKEFRENIFRYFGVNDKIIMSDFTETSFEYFYESRIEPFLIALSLELTQKIFTERELGFKNEIIYESNKLQFASFATKLNFVSLVDRGAMTPNEWREIFNLPPIDGGEEPIRRLDTVAINDNNLQKQNEASESSEED